MNDAPESIIYIVTYSYDYEDTEVAWVGTSWPTAVDKANTIEFGDRVTITAWQYGEMVEGWTRPSSYWRTAERVTKHKYMHYKAPNTYYDKANQTEVELGWDVDD